jgi:putative ABC transport system permease protein
MRHLFHMDAMIVVSRNVDVGQTVAASLQAPILFLIAQDLTRMQVNTNVSEADIGLVSVTERTREIGIRMAVGAKHWHILAQFLLEAVVLSTIGGILGVICGVVGARLVSVLAGRPTLLSPEVILLAVAFSSAVGIFFGFFPARHAAHLDPIQALRYE